MTRLHHAHLARAGISAGWHLLAPILRRKRSENAIRRACREKPTLYLTYDDGPSAELTPALLDLLDTLHAPATFFFLGSRVEAHPDVTKRAASLGHAIALHGQNHPNAWKISHQEARRDIDQGLTAFEKIGIRPELYRPPYGKLTAPIEKHLARRGLRIAWWTVDTLDTTTPPPAPEDLAQKLCAQHGGVVLMHDFDRPDPTRRADRNRHVLQLTEHLVQVAIQNNISIAPLTNAPPIETHP